MCNYVKNNLKVYFYLILLIVINNIVIGMFYSINKYLNGFVDLPTCDKCIMFGL